jgi:hypothetical protein
MREEVGADIRDIFNSPGEAEAKLLLEKTNLKYETSAPELATWMETALPEGFDAHFCFLLHSAHRISAWLG